MPEQYCHVQGCQFFGFSEVSFMMKNTNTKELFQLSFSELLESIYIMYDICPNVPGIHIGPVTNMYIIFIEIALFNLS